MLVLGASHGLSEKTAQRRFLSSDGRPVRVTRTAAWRIRKFWWPLAQRRPGPAALAMPLSLYVHVPFCPQPAAPGPWHADPPVGQPGRSSGRGWWTSIITARTKRSGGLAQRRPDGGQPLTRL